MDIANAPELLKVVESLKKIAIEAKLEEPLEISQPIEANPISLTPWIICLRSGASERAKKLVYSVFFKNNDTYHLGQPLSSITARPRFSRCCKSSHDAS